MLKLAFHRSRALQSLCACVGDWKTSISLYLLITIYSHDNSLQDTRRDYVVPYSILVVCTKVKNHVERIVHEVATFFHCYNIIAPRISRGKGQTTVRAEPATQKRIVRLKEYLGTAKQPDCMAS